MVICLLSYVLVKAPCECATDIIERGCGRENSPRALSFLETATCSIISVVYERKRCFSWLVARSGPVKTSQVISISMDF